MIHLLYLSMTICMVTAGKRNPNIVVIVADDLGWRDVSYHGSDDIMTPNIDNLAYQGIILQQYHTDVSGSASRAAFLTGKYPMRLGLQGPSLRGYEDYGIPPSERLLPMFLRQLDYATHLVGKWHVGFSRNCYLPTNRGFDSFYGFHTSGVDYYTKNHIENSKETYFGLDFYENTTPITNETGYITDVFTDRAVNIIKTHNSSAGPLFLQVSYSTPHVGMGGIPLQAPLDSYNANSHIAHPGRRHYAAMVQTLDKGIGKVILALEKKNILNDTLIVFMADNGGISIGDCGERNFGSNLPLRGTKNFPWDGAVRVPAVIWHSLFHPAVWNGLFHVTDWFPTLISAGGGIPGKDIDGVDHWTTITHKKGSERTELLVTMDNINGFAAYKYGGYKMIVGHSIKKDGSGFYGYDFLKRTGHPPNYEEALLNCESVKVLSKTSKRPLSMSLIHKKRNATLLHEKGEVKGTLCMPTSEKGCLYNITEDPLEIDDIWDEAPKVVQTLTLKLRKLWSVQRPRHIVIDERSKPSLHKYVWRPWANNSEKIGTEIKTRKFPLEVSIEEMESVVADHMDSFTDRVFNYVKSVRGSVMNSIKKLFY